MTYSFGKKSRDRLVGVHPDLVRVMERAIEITKFDFVITEGVRSFARQEQLFKSGASKTMRSRHLTGHAVDIAPYLDGSPRWDWPPFYIVAAAIKQAASELKVDVRWGGDWLTFKDGPHWELSWKGYP